MTTLQDRVDQPRIRQKAFHEPGRDSNGVTINKKFESNTFFLSSSTLGDVSLPPSTKLTAAMAVIYTWLTEHPNDKIIGKDEVPLSVREDMLMRRAALVYTQFVTTGKVLAAMLEEVNIKFLSYFGSSCIGPNNKARALDSFNNNSSVKVLVRPCN